MFAVVCLGWFLFVRFCLFFLVFVFGYVGKLFFLASFCFCLPLLAFVRVSLLLFDFVCLCLYLFVCYFCLPGSGFIYLLPFGYFCPCLLRYCFAFLDFVSFCLSLLVLFALIALVYFCFLGNIMFS